MACDCDYILSTRDGWMEHYDNCSSMLGANKKALRSPDGTLRLTNDHLLTLEHDHLHHLGLDTTNYNLPAIFGDVKFVCIGGTKNRMREFAYHMADVLSVDTGGGLENMTKHSHRYAMYKVGPVLSVNHGIGIPSMTVVLQELIKLLYYAKVKNPIFFRIGTCGGLDIPPGSVVVSEWALNGTLEKSYDIPILGKIRKLPAHFDQRLCQEVQSMITENDGFKTYVGGTMAADDFYRGQGRLDGPFCDYSEDDKYAFLKTLVGLGVKNIEMEATALAAITTEAGIRASDVCVTLVNRLVGDKPINDKSSLTTWQKRPMLVVGRYISAYVNNRKTYHSNNMH